MAPKDVEAYVRNALLHARQITVELSYEGDDRSRTAATSDRQSIDHLAGTLHVIRQERPSRSSFNGAIVTIEGAVNIKLEVSGDRIFFEYPVLGSLSIRHAFLEWLEKFVESRQRSITD